MSHYDKYPTITAADGAACWRGWSAICGEMGGAIHAKATTRTVVAVECYTGLLPEVEKQLRNGLAAKHFFYSADVFKSPQEIDDMVSPWLGGDDPIFGRYTTLELMDFLDSQKCRQMRREIELLRGVIIVYGPAALLCCEPDIIIYADMPRWEGQLRHRRNEVSNLGVENKSLKGSLQYKRSFFVDWRVCDRLKAATMDRWDYLLDTTIHGDPKLVTGAALRGTLDRIVHRPFRVVPFFDPAPWGGQWMKKHFELDPAPSNYGWGFDCVPEENSLLLDFSGIHVEIPAMNLVFFRPQELLGDAIYKRFGPEFPIRFDFLDTIQGGNLSLQVHPLRDFARQQFGLAYTQDESYYILQAESDATVFLGVKNSVDSERMLRELEEADRGGRPFSAEKFVNKWPARKHDHFPIPAGTVHCSGAGTLVLEISATPYIFTFKLWDWGRLGLDGLPRPTNIQRGRSVLQWNRDENWTRAELIQQIQPLESGVGWRAERTGLHLLEFIETHRHWFTDKVPHHTHGSVNVLNLVEGDAAMVESPTGAFEPFEIHYAETFIMPAAVGDYTVRPRAATSTELATIKAMVRSA